MEMITEWIRVTHGDPCRICGKPDWCTYTADQRAACCMRIKSDTPARNGGWMHSMDNTPQRRTYVQRQKPAPPKQTEAIPFVWRRLEENSTPDKIVLLAKQLHVTPTALFALGCRYSHNCTYAFPMKDETGQIIGIRLRSGLGDKYAVPGSRAGLFYDKMIIDGTCLITEGPTDTAAALSLGFNAIGRSACRGQEQMLKALMKRNPKADFVLCPDKDAPGMDGARDFAKFAKITMRMLIPPCKDLRQWLQSGATHEEVLHTIENSRWINIS